MLRPRTSHLPALAACVLLCGCRKTPLLGAALIPSSSIPSGSLVATYSPSGCTDGSDRTSRRVVDHVRDQHGAPILVERADAASWIVIKNTFVDGPQVVFQAIQESSVPATAWEYRVPADGQGAGSFRSSNSFTVEDLQGGVFRATLLTELNRCALVRVDPMTGRPTGMAAAGSAAFPGSSAASPPSPPFASGAEEPKSWGYDGSTFKEGDRILVDQGARSVGAVVLRSDGRQYYVHVDGAPPGTGMWVPPWRVTGRLRP